jgi:hypothetical protein
MMPMRKFDALAKLTLVSHVHRRFGKALLFLPTLLASGLALALPEFGFRVGFACLKPGRFAAVRRAQDSPLFETCMGSRFDLRPVFRLARLVKQHQGQEANCLGLG